MTKHGDTIYVTGAPPFDPKTGEIFKGAIGRQTEIVSDQLKLCVETAGSSLGCQTIWEVPEKHQTFRFTSN